MAKTSTLTFAQVLESDLNAIGAGLDEDKRIDKISAPREVTLPDGSSINVTDTLSFWLPDASLDPIKIDYILEVTDTLSTKDGDVELYQVVRHANGNSSSASGDRLRSFCVVLLSNGGSDVGTNVENTRMIRVSFATALPFNTDDDFYMRQVHWGISLRPPNLN